METNLQPTVEIIDYSEMYFKMDKFMPEYPNIISYYDSLITNDIASNEKELYNFFLDYAYEDEMENYMPDGGTLEGFVRYIISMNMPCQEN